MILLISAGHAEDMIGATLAQKLDTTVQVLPLVAQGKAYQGIAEVIHGPFLDFPSGGFPFNNLQNLKDDLKAGLLTVSIQQWLQARNIAQDARAVVVVGDAYALFVGYLAASLHKIPLFHLQPQVSYYYWGDRTTLQRLKQVNQFGAEDYLFYERWLHQFVDRVYVRDEYSLKRAHALGMHKSRFVGNMAMDTLKPASKDLGVYRDARPLVALMPGTRADVQFSLPLMLETMALLPHQQGIVAWAKPFDEVVLPAGWQLDIHSETAVLASCGSTTVWLLRGYFSEILYAATSAMGTAGTANEQAAGLGLPVIAFPTPGPQYTEPNAIRQKRLLGRSLFLVEPQAAVIAQALEEVLTHPDQLLAARFDGIERNGSWGGLANIAQEIQAALA